jgi:hypothetical protein
MQELRSLSIFHDNNFSTRGRLLAISRPAHYAHKNLWTVDRSRAYFAKINQ